MNVGIIRLSNQQFLVTGIVKNTDKMDTQTLNVFILSDNALVVNGLRHSLESKFRQNIRVTGFYDSRNCIKKVDENTHVVILDYFLEGKSCIPTLKCIQAINPKCRIIMHSCFEDVASAIESLMVGEVRYNTPIQYNENFITQFR
jgi:DNA-binding NarL/FixJ family response regulator